MKRLANIKTVTYAVGIENFMVDIIIHAEGEIQYESWLYREGIGIKEYLYGVIREYGLTLRQVAKDVKDYITTPNSLGMTDLDTYDEKYGEG